MKSDKPQKPRIKPPSAPKYDPDKSGQENAEEYLTFAARRLDWLMDRYGIDRNDPNSWFLLSLNLAAEHEPGFKPAPMKERKGRRSNPKQGAKDVLLFMSLMQAELAGVPVAARCMHLVNTEPAFEGNNPETLRKRYYEKLLKPSSSEGRRLREQIAFLMEREEDPEYRRSFELMAFRLRQEEAPEK